MRKSFIEHFQGKLYWDGDWDYDDTIEFLNDEEIYKSYFRDRNRPPGVYSSGVKHIIHYETPVLRHPTEAEVATAEEPAGTDEEVVAAAEATVAQRRAAGQPSSRYVGVSWEKKQRQWMAQIKHAGTTHRLGIFVAEAEAARMAPIVAAREAAADAAMKELLAEDEQEKEKAAVKARKKKNKGRKK